MESEGQEIEMTCQGHMAAVVSDNVEIHSWPMFSSPLYHPHFICHIQTLKAASKDNFGEVKILPAHFLLVAVVIHQIPVPL